MSYTPTEWKNGDTITANKLNKIEEGIENCTITAPYKIEVEEDIEEGEEGEEEVKIYIISQDIIDYIIENEPLFIYGSIIGEEFSGETMERFKVTECYTLNEVSYLDNFKRVAYKGSAGLIELFSKEMLSQIDPAYSKFTFLTKEFSYNEDSDSWIGGGADK